MEHWPDQDRVAFARVIGGDNTAALGPWTAVAATCAGALAVSGSARLWVPALVLAVVSACAAVWGRFRPSVVAERATGLGAGLVLSTALAVDWMLVARPAAVAAAAPTAVLVVAGAGLLFTWPAIGAAAVLGGAALAWLVAVTLGPGWGSDPAGLAAASLLVIGAALAGLLAQRHRYFREVERFEEVREARRAVDEVADDQLRLQAAEQEKDRLYGDATDALREPTVRLLRDLDTQREAEAAQAQRLEPAWQDGLRLLRNLDDLRTMASIERGYCRLRLRRIDLARELQTLVDALGPRVAVGGGSVDLVVHGVPDDIHVDTVHLERAVVAMIGRAVERGGEFADVQVELGSEADPVQGEQAWVEVWCDAPEDAWPPEPQGRARRGYRPGPPLEVQVARALVELHRGRFQEPEHGSSVLSWKLWLRAGTGHLTNEILDRRFRDEASASGERRLGDSDDMTWAEALERDEAYRFLDVVRAVAGAAPDEPVAE